MRFSALSANDLKDVVELFKACFIDDPYYAKQFRDQDEKIDAFHHQFSENILFCIRQGSCFGIRDGEDRLLAFLLCFDYNAARNGSVDAFCSIFGCASLDELPYREELHRRILEQKEKTLYVLSLAVREQERRQGIGSCLIDHLIVSYPDYDIVSDVSNPLSLSIYEKRGFAIRLIDEAYYYICRSAENSGSMPGADDGIRVLIPDDAFLDSNQIGHTVVSDRCFVIGYGKAEKAGVSFYRRNAGSITEGKIVSFDPQSFLEYQRLINVMQYDEERYPLFWLYTQLLDYTEPPLFNDVLREMAEHRRQEWAVIPDVYISIPVAYSDRGLLVRNEESKLSEWLMSILNFRTSYEAGIPSNISRVDDLANVKKRIRRVFLGNIRVQLLAEQAPENTARPRDRIGPPAYVSLYISYDDKSNCGVVTLCSLSSPFLVSQYLDSMVRNQIMVRNEEKEENLFDYLHNRFGLVKQGTPKAYVVIPKEKDCLSPNQIASLLASETIYPDGEVFGRITDREIMEIAENPAGMGQYDRATICAYKNVALQFSPDMTGSMRYRVREESITLFYMELILFEEAAVHIANHSIIQALSSHEVIDPVRFLKNTDAIYDRFSSTIGFWNIRVNYPTSQKSVKMLRDAFCIDELLSEFDRNQEYLQKVFDTKCDIIDRMESKRMNGSLAVISILAIFSALIDGHDYIGTCTGVLSDNAIAVLQKLLFFGIVAAGLYVIARLLGYRLGSAARLRRERRRRMKEKEK